MSRTMVNSRIFFMALMIATSGRAEAPLRVTLLGHTTFRDEPIPLREIVYSVRCGPSLLPGAKKEDQRNEQVNKVEIRQP